MVYKFYADERERNAEIVPPLRMEDPEATWFTCHRWKGRPKGNNPIAQRTEKRAGTSAIKTIGKEKMKYHFRVHKEKEGGYWGQGIEIKGCFSQGDDMKELRENLREALEAVLEEPLGSKIVPPMPKTMKTKRGIVAVDVNPKIAFAITLRNLRHKEGLTQSQMAKKLAIKNLSQYQRLEDPRRANPELLTLKRIKTSFPQLNIDEILAA